MPAAQPGSTPSRRPKRLLVAAGVGVAVAAAIVAALLPPRPARPLARGCPSVAGSRLADLDGDGCPSAVSWQANVAGVEGRRYELGRPGDALLLGDWDCDGARTPALYRPSTGEVFRFDGWAAHGTTVAATDGGRFPAGGIAEVEAGPGGCERVVVRTGPSHHA